jgi:hypothetical protein
MVKDLVSFCGSESRPVNLKIAILGLSTPMEITPDSTSKYLNHADNRNIL